MFRDRRDAGLRLAHRLLATVEAQPKGSAHPLVLGLPRGGVPVAFEIARALESTLDVLVVRKIGAPGQEELGVGALVGDNLVINRQLMDELNLCEASLASTIAREKIEAARREALYRKGRPPLQVRGTNVILVDDGIATGGSARAAVQALRAMGAAFITLAVPVGPATTLFSLRNEVDELVCLFQPPFFHAVGQFYAEFNPTTDEEVLELLKESYVGLRPT